MTVAPFEFHAVSSVAVLAFPFDLLRFPGIYGSQPESDTELNSTPDSFGPPKIYGCTLGNDGCEAHGNTKVMRCYR